MAKAKSDNQDNTIYTTDVATFGFNDLITPDTKFSADGAYKVELVMSEDEARAFSEKFKAPLERHRAAAKAEYDSKPARVRDNHEFKVRPIFAREYDKDDKPTGNFTVKFTSKAGGTRKDGSRWSRKIPLFDGAGRPITPSAIYRGTKGRVAFKMVPYWTEAAGGGVSLRLEAVQIHELNEGGNRDAAGFGFGTDVPAIDCGDSDYSHEDSPEDPPFDADDTQRGGGFSADF